MNPNSVQNRSRFKTSMRKTSVLGWGHGRDGLQSPFLCVRVNLATKVKLPINPSSMLIAKQEVRWEFIIWAWLTPLWWSWTVLLESSPATAENKHTHMKTKICAITCNCIYVTRLYRTSLSTCICLHLSIIAVRVCVCVLPVRCQGSWRERSQAAACCVWPWPTRSEPRTWTRCFAEPFPWRSGPGREHTHPKHYQYNTTHTHCTTVSL